MRRLPTRQVHLDFHTSEFMEGVGENFNKKQFQEALQMGHVNSITVFGKCHHGYFYYPTKVGTVHPGMEPGKDLAGEMMDACHEIGVYAPLYLTLGWSALDAKEHPEWIARKRDGSYSGSNYDFYARETDVKPEASWVHLCSAGNYREYLYEMTREACDRYDRLDGVFYDIVFINDACYCDYCVNGMRKMGLNPALEADAKKYYEIQKKITLDGLCEIVKEKHPDATIFFNSGGAEVHMPQWHYASTHFELEDLPTTWGGYDKMPMRARYFSRLGKDYLGMTGKFHRSWGEFGGYKTPEALTYECAAMLANGARVSVGDQLHPLGKMDMETYQNIGKAYSYIEKIETYCFDTKETARLGVMVSLDAKRNEAMAKLLLDCQVDFDVVHNETDLARFDTVIIPDQYRLSECMGLAFDSYVKQGGKVFIMGGGGLKEYKDEFAFSVPFTYQGKSSYDKDYFELSEEFLENKTERLSERILEGISERVPEGILSSPILCYTSAHMVEGDGTVYSFVREPYFSRTYGKYCSHYNTPYRETYAQYPGAVQNGNILYVAHELAGMYADYGVTYHRRYFKWLLRKLYCKDCVNVEMPSQGRIHMVKREDQKQYVLHLMYASPVQRGGVSILEDFPTLRDIPVTLHVPEEIRKVTLVPQNQEIPFETEGKGYKIMIPEVTGHQMVVLNY